MKSGVLLSLAIAILFFSGCLRDETNSLFNGPSFDADEYAVISARLNIDRQIESFPVDLPRHMRLDGNATEPHPATALLGRVLFYDTQVSITGETSCASCHKQDKAFSDDIAFSHGINGQETKRNSQALAAVPNFEASYGTSGNGGEFVQFFWDERASSITQQSRETIENAIEMGHDLPALAEQLNSQEMYRILAQRAFRTETLQPNHILTALETFCNALVSTNSRFDRLMDQEIFGPGSNNEPQWTRQEQEGRALYNRDCASCHSFDMSFPGEATASNGLDVEYLDKGKGEVSGSVFNGIFKVPFLRNIELTAPYMHDGRFATLEDVLDHYSSNIQPHANLSRQLTNQATGQPKRFNYTEEDKAAIIQFLKSTTDNVLPELVRFSDPFLQ